jgi:hypothetical protein
MGADPWQERVTVNGQTLTKRVWALLDDAYTAAGMNPDSYLTVTQGSFKGGSGADASGSTHDGGGAFDLRTWNLPASVQANLCAVLIDALRRRNVCAWYRDQAHGGFDPHIHGIVRDEPGLSSGAAWQVAEYDRVHNGLSNQGPDYHARPPQTPFDPEETDVPLTPTEITAIADAVWAKIIRTADGDKAAATVMTEGRNYARRASEQTPTVCQGGGSGGASPDAIAGAVADELSARLEE